MTVPAPAATAPAPLAKLVIEKQFQKSCLPSPLCSSSCSNSASSSPCADVVGGELMENASKSDPQNVAVAADEPTLPLSPTSPFDSTAVNSGASISISADETTDEASLEDNPTDDTSSEPAPTTKTKKKYSSPSSSTARKCAYCGVTSTPMWRHGPGEFTNLCNSCGVKWRRGKILSSGENAHHLMKVAPAKKISSTPAAATTTAVKSSSPTIAADSTSAPVVSKKRKGSVTFDEWNIKEANDAGWDLPRTRNGRSCARKLWGVQASSDADAPIEEASKTTVEPAPSSIPTEAAPVPAKSLRSSSPSPVIQGDEPTSVAISLFQTLPPPQSANPNILNPHDMPAFYNSLLHQLTAEFAALLDKLDAPKTAIFTSILAKGFEPRMRAAYESGVEIEMSVMDISPDTWEALRAVV